MKPTWLNRDVARPGPILTLVDSQEEYNAVMKHCRADFQPAFNREHARAHVTLMVREDSGEPLAVVCLGDLSGLDSISIASMLVHEAAHVWQLYAQKLGEEKPGDEQEAYAMQYISETLMREYARRFVKRKR